MTVPMSTLLKVQAALDAARPHCDPCVYPQLLEASTELLAAIRNEQMPVVAVTEPATVHEFLMKEPA